MPIWSEILDELRRTPNLQGHPDYDGIRRKYLTELHQHTGIPVILYASGWIQKPDAPPSLVTINNEARAQVLNTLKVFTTLSVFIRPWAIGRWWNLKTTINYWKKSSYE